MPAPLTECLTKTQTEVSWAWPPLLVEIRLWANPNLPDEPILQVTLPGNSSKPPLATLYPDGVRMDGEVEEKDEGMEWRLGPGWIELRLAITENMTLSTTRESSWHLVNSPLPRHLHSLHLTASNLTANCPTGDEISP